MNSVHLIGRLTRDIELRYTNTQLAVARFSVAIDRGKDKDGNDRGADFPTVVVFGRTAENCEKYLGKGKQVAVTGHLQTGSYDDRDGKKVYTTEVIADRVEFIDWGDRQDRREAPNAGGSDSARPARDNRRDDGIPEGFEALEDDDIPF